MRPDLADAILLVQVSLIPTTESLREASKNLLDIISKSDGAPAEVVGRLRDCQEFAASPCQWPIHLQIIALADQLRQAREML